MAVEQMEPSQEQLDYLDGPATRADLLRLADCVRQALAPQMQSQTALVQAGMPDQRPALAGSLAAADNLSGFIRELLNAGEDPDPDED